MEYLDGIVIFFKNPHDARNYYQILKEKGIYPKETIYNSELFISNMNREFILKFVLKQPPQPKITVAEPDIRTNFAM